MDSLWNESLLAPIPDEIYPTYITSKVNNQTKRITLTGDKKYLDHVLHLSQCGHWIYENELGDFHGETDLKTWKWLNSCATNNSSLNKKLKNKEGVINIPLTFNQFLNISEMCAKLSYQDMEESSEFPDYGLGVAQNISDIFKSVF